MALIGLVMTETQPFSLTCQVLSNNNTRWAAPRGALGGPGGEGTSANSRQTSLIPRGPRGFSGLQKQPPRSLPGPSEDGTAPQVRPSGVGPGHNQWRPIGTGSTTWSLLWTAACRAAPLARERGARLALAPRGPARPRRMARHRASADRCATAQGIVNWTYRSAAGINKSL